ncbi:hypothetical protein FHS85_003342 [Rhodoligotrophos appendicifer]|uniref:hypothetical protein n=1 Tax=Rhodoligotrophos appendicifer TaxID=987056 RepID=UPI001184EB3E|nr:hypothetical protein [Rhodoligotrophos appendicifer]
MNKIGRGEDPRWDWDDSVDEPRKLDPLRDPFQTGPKPPRPAAPPHKRPANQAPAAKGINPRLLILAGAALLVVILLGLGAYFLFGGRGTLNTGGGDAPRSIVLAPTEKVIFGGELQAIKAAAESTVQQGSSSSDNPTVVIRSTNPNARPVNTTEGAYVTLPLTTMTELAGKRVRITAWARAADQRPSGRFAIAFASGPSISSGWLVFTPTTSFQPFSFDVMFPKDPKQDGYVGLWSDISGQGGGIELRLLTERIVQ